MTHGIYDLVTSHMNESCHRMTRQSPLSYGVTRSRFKQYGRELEESRYAMIHVNESYAV